MALVNPHGGGSLKPLLLEGDALKAELARAQALPKVTVSSREAGDINEYYRMLDETYELIFRCVNG